MVWAYKVRIRYRQNRYTITEAWCKHYKGSTVPLYVRAHLRSRFIEFLAWGICCMVQAHTLKKLLDCFCCCCRLLRSLFSLDQSFYVILIKDFMLVMHCFRISELRIPVNNIGTTYWLTILHTNGRVKCNILIMYLTGLPVVYYVLLVTSWEPMVNICGWTIYPWISIPQIFWQCSIHCHRWMTLFDCFSVQNLQLHLNLSRFIDIPNAGG